MAIVTGTTNTSMNAVVMTDTATQRRRARFSTARITDQVDTTIIVAQTIAGMNGRSTQREPPTSTISNTMTSRLRVRSGPVGNMGFMARHLIG